MRSAPADSAFWGKSGAGADAGWLEDLATADSDPGDAAEAHGLDDLAAARQMPVDPVFDELKDMGPPAAAVTLGAPPPPDVAPGAVAIPDPAPEADTPAADFDWTGVSDDLLPTWKLDL